MSREAQNTTSMAIKIKDNEIQNSKTEKLLCMTIDDKFNFNNHLQKMLKKLIIKVNVLPKITPYMCILKRKLIMNSFFISQLNCCPLVWKSHSSLMNKRVNWLHEKCIRIVYSDKTSSFEELLDKDGSVTIHTRN